MSGSRTSRRCACCIAPQMSDQASFPPWSAIYAPAPSISSGAPATEAPPQPRRGTATAHTKIDKSVLTISEPKRIRCKEHLRFVASQPCLICGRTPSHAHHVRYAQSRGLSLKVSDEFTVPLCAIHHHNIHTTGKEREWWQERNIDPLKAAAALWQQSRQLQSSPAEKDASQEITSQAELLQRRETEPPDQAAAKLSQRSPSEVDVEPDKWCAPNQRIVGFSNGSLVATSQWPLGQ